MRQLLIVVALACAAATAAAQAPAAKSDAGRLKSDVVNEEAIRKLYDQFVAAWNKHDPKAMAAMWVESPLSRTGLSTTTTESARPIFTISTARMIQRRLPRSLRASSSGHGHAASRT